MWTPLALSLALLVTASGLAYVIYRLGSRRSDVVPEPEWLSSFSADRYRPMLRMLSERDYAWLAEQGLSKSAIRKLRAERRRIFRTYLDNMVRDFERLHASARALLYSSQVDRPELTERLVSLRLNFQRTVLVVRFRLALHALGLKPVDVSGLVGAIETIHQDFRMLASGPMMASSR